MSHAPGAPPRGVNAFVTKPGRFEDIVQLLRDLGPSLLVDDSAAYREEFGVLPGRPGIRDAAVDVALSAAEGRRLIAAGVHDLERSDGRLPGQGGLLLIRAARAAGSAKPIIVLTGYDNPRVDAAAVEAGANDYLRKGDFTPELLGRPIRSAVRNAAAVEAARAAGMRFVMAQEAADVGTREGDIAVDTFLWSARQYANFGMSADAAEPVTHERWLTVIHPDDREPLVAGVPACIAAQTDLSVRLRVLRGRRNTIAPDRPAHWILAKGRAVRDGRGNTVEMVGVSLDITEQRNALDAVQDSRNVALAGLHTSQTRLRAYFDSAPQCLFVMRVAPDRRSVSEAMNPVALAIAGGDLGLIRNRTPEEVIGPENARLMDEALRRVLDTGAPYLFEPPFRHRMHDVVRDAIHMPMFDATGAVVGILGNARDITGRRSSKPRCGRRGRWRRLARSPAASRTTSTIC